MEEKGKGAESGASGGIASQLQTYAMWGVPAALFIYITGYLGLSIYMSRLGVPTQSLLEPQYIATGIWILTPLVIGLAMLYAGMASVNDEPWDPVSSVGEWWGRIRPDLLRMTISLVLLLLAYLLLVVLILPLVALVGPRFAAPSGVNFWMALGWLFLAIAGIFGLATFFIPRVRRFLSAVGPQRSGQELAKLIAASVIFGVLFLAYVGLFAAFYLPYIPATLGGGRPLPVRFILADDKPESLGSGADALLPADPENPRRSTRRFLFFATDADYVIGGINDQGCVVFDRGLVDGYVVDLKE